MKRAHSPPSCGDHEQHLHEAVVRVGGADDKHVLPHHGLADRHATFPIGVPFDKQILAVGVGSQAGSQLTAKAKVGSSISPVVGPWEFD